MPTIIRFRTVFLVMLVITILTLLAPPLLGVAFAAFSYQGTCYGFTDGSWPCSWNEYLSEQAFWSVWLDLPLGVFLISAWLAAAGIWFYRRRNAEPVGLPSSMIVLIPVGGCLGGFFLLSMFSVFIRLAYGFRP